jgi:hypothetical protein
LSITVLIAIGAGIVVALLVVDFLLYRLTIRALIGLIDHLPRYRPGGRYRSQSTPERYASLRNHGTSSNAHLQTLMMPWDTALGEKPALSSRNLRCWT